MPRFIIWLLLVIMRSPILGAIVSLMTLTQRRRSGPTTRQDMSMGVMNDWEYRAKWYNEDEATAKKMLPKMEDMTDEKEEEIE